MKTIGTKNIQPINEIVLSLRGNINYTHISYRQLYFVAVCSLLDLEADGEIAPKFRPYGFFSLKIEQEIVLNYRPLGYGRNALPLCHPALIQTYNYEHVKT